MEAAEAKPFGLSAAGKTASQEENDTVEKRAEEAELHEETSEFLEAAGGFAFKSARICAAGF